MKDGSDDCGDCLAGPGTDSTLLGLDVAQKILPDSENEHLFLDSPWSIATGRTSAFNVVASRRGGDEFHST